MAFDAEDELYDITRTTKVKLSSAFWVERPITDEWRELKTHNYLFLSIEDLDHKAKDGFSLFLSKLLRTRNKKSLKAVYLELSYKADQPLRPEMNEECIACLGEALSKTTSRVYLL